MKRLLATVASITLGLSPLAAQPDDFLRQTGKIYVAVGVLSIIFIGIVAYLVVLDLRLGRLEKQHLTHPDPPTDRAKP